MGDLDLKVSRAGPADMAAQSETGPADSMAKADKPKVNPDTELHLASEEDTVGEDDLELVAEPLPLFGTRGNRHLG